MVRRILMAAAFLGIVASKVMLALSEGWRAGTATTRTTEHNMYAQFLAQQNATMLGHLLTAQNRFINELLAGDSEESDSSIKTIHEISCRQDHVEMVRSLMDDHSETVVKEAAIWATQNAAGYNLTMRAISLETEPSHEPERQHDIVLVFHVNGKGEDALRFQADASRRLREVTSRPDVAPAVKMLRADVRWT
jgi:hypothetical protein